MLAAMVGLYLIERRVTARQDKDLPAEPAPVFLVAADRDHNT